MTTGSAELLKGLASGVNPFRAGGDGARIGGTEAPGALDFASMLQKARSGAVSTGKPVSVADGAGVNLNEAQLGRLEQAADVAEASGATKALVLMDGMAFKLDVGVRAVTGASVFDNETVLTGFDAIVRVPAQGAPAAQTAATLPAGFGNASLLKVLSRERDGE